MLNIIKITGLNELNLRRNVITGCDCPVNGLQNLERLYLNNNNVHTLPPLPLRAPVGPPSPPLAPLPNNTIARLLCPTCHLYLS